MVLAAGPKMMAFCITLASAANPFRRTHELALLDIGEEVEISANKKTWVLSYDLKHAFQVAFAEQ